MNKSREIPVLTNSDLLRFWKNVEVRSNGECWEWAGMRTDKGYGQFHLNGGRCGAHRVSWRVANGRDPAYLFICHRCDNPKCVNPKHLFAGSNSDNIKDAVRKGRYVCPAKRKTHCKRGHQFIPQNTGIDNAGNRYCKKCKAAWGKRYYVEVRKPAILENQS